MEKQGVVDRRVTAQLQSHQLKFEKTLNPKTDESTIIEGILKDMDTKWGTIIERLKIVPGKDFLSEVNSYLQKEFKITITIANIISGMQKVEIPKEVVSLISEIDAFRKLEVPV